MGPASDANRVHIFDTTLRDGEQSPGISLNTAEKVEITQQLARLGVDVIEAGFPITSPGDFEAVQKISRVVEGPVVCGLARTHKADIDAAWGAVRDAQRPRIHTFISTSDIHIEHQLQTDREDVKGQARAAVSLAKSYCEDVEFSPMDATRAEIEFTAEVCAIAVEEGATVVDVSDTVGYTPRRRSTRTTSAASMSWCRRWAGSRRRSTATTTWGWRSPTPTPAFWRGRVRSSARSTGSASARATARWRRSRCWSRSARTSPASPTAINSREIARTSRMVTA